MNEGPEALLGTNGGAAILCGGAARFAMLSIGVMFAAVAICTYAMLEAIGEARSN